VKRYLLPLTAIVIAAHLACGRSIEGLGGDHLEPQPFRAHLKYRKVLLSKLGVTPYNHGRLIVLPFSDREDSQSVYSRSSKGRRIYYITRISSEESLWNRTDGGRYPERARSVKTHRIDIEMPERTAELLRQVWLGMLEGPQGPRPTPPPNPHILPQLHPMYFEFSIERADGAPLVGALNLSAGSSGEKTKRLVELSEEIYHYCIAQPAKRPAIAKKIDEKAQNLLGLLSN
jgi:hypothetical protein